MSEQGIRWSSTSITTNCFTSEIEIFFILLTIYKLVKMDYFRNIVNCSLPYPYMVWFRFLIVAVFFIFFLVFKSAAILYLYMYLLQLILQWHEFLKIPQAVCLFHTCLNVNLMFTVQLFWKCKINPVLIFWQENCVISIWGITGMH